MKEVKEANVVKVFQVEGEAGLFKKITSKQALEFNAANEDERDHAIQAILGSTLSWFIPFEEE